ncbi:hypothetical protein [Maricaulis sp.]|uniref:hypothetical protein n=1 Tax=Maricaulis sp. TaxID=1486257 RepID=UPI003A8DDA58
MMRALLALSLLAVGISGVEAQVQPQPQTRTTLPTLRNPALLQRPDAEQDGQDEDEASDAPVLTRRTLELYREAQDEASNAPVVTRRTLELYREAQEEERRRAAGPRPLYYEVECHAVTELRFDVTDFRITCDRNDPYGQNYYFLWLDMDPFPPQDAAGTNEDRQVRAERLVEAVNMTRNDPGANLILLIGPLELNGGIVVRDINGYTIRYTD